MSDDSKTIDPTAAADWALALEEKARIANDKHRGELAKLRATIGELEAEIESLEDKQRGRIQVLEKREHDRTRQLKRDHAAELRAAQAATDSRQKDLDATVAKWDAEKASRGDHCRRIQVEARRYQERMQAALNDNIALQDRIIGLESKLDSWRAYCKRMLATLGDDGRA